LRIPSSKRVAEAGFRFYGNQVLDGGNGRQQRCHLPDSRAHFQHVTAQEWGEFPHQSCSIIPCVFQRIEFKVFHPGTRLGLVGHDDFTLLEILYLRMHQKA
jgi:hypothetical protein